MELNEYQNRALQTVLFEKCYNQEYLKAGLVEEVGEVLGKFKRAIRDDDTKKDANGDLILNKEQLDAIVLELGDVFWYLSVLSHKLGFSLEEVAARNVEKLAKRKAEGKIKGSGDNR